MKIQLLTLALLTTAAAITAGTVLAAEPSVTNRGYRLQMVAPFSSYVVDSGDNLYAWLPTLEARLYRRGHRTGIAVSDLMINIGIPQTATGSATPHDFRLWLGMGGPALHETTGLFLITVPRPQEGLAVKKTAIRAVIPKLAVSLITSMPSGPVWASGSHGTAVISGDGSVNLPVSSILRHTSVKAFFPSPEGPRMWLVTANDRGYVSNSFRAEETKTIGEIGQAYWWSSFAPIGDGRFAWAEPKNHADSGDLYLAVNDGAIKPLRALLGSRRAEFYTTLPGKPEDLWVVAGEGRDLYHIECTNGEPVVRSHLLASERLGQILTNDGIHFWTWSEKGLYFARIDSDHLILTKLRLASRPLKVALIPGTSLAAVEESLAAGALSALMANFGWRKSDPDDVIEIWDVTQRLGQQSRMTFGPQWRLSRSRMDAHDRPWLIGGRENATYEVLAESPIRRATLAFGEAILSTDQNPPAILKFGPEFFSSSVNLTDNEGKAIASGTVRVILRTPGEKEDVKPVVDLEEAQSGLMPVSTLVHTGVPYDVVLEYTAKDGLSAAVITWRNVRFAAPLLTLRSVRTALAYGVIVLFSLALILLPIPSRVRGWLPALTLASSATGIWTSRAASFVDAPILAILLAATIIIATGAGLVSASLYRALAKIEPLRSLSGIALIWRPVRKRLLTPYADIVREQIRLARRDANYETYVAIPAVFVAQASTSVDVEPAGAIAKMLAQRPDHTSHVLVQAPGGRGKTALFNETINLLLDNFRTDAGAPLPVLCNETATTLEENASAVLGKFAISREAVEAQLASGKFVLAVEGLTESPITPEIIRTFLSSATAESTPFFATSRPNDQYRRVFEADPSSILVEPMRLDDTSLRAFEETYLGADSKLPCRPLTDAMKRICRTVDGGYLPILVRLAMISASDVDDVPALYDDVCASLLRRAGEPDRATIDSAARLCTETYWVDGVRTLSYERANEVTAAILTALLRASIAIPAGPLGPRDNGAPREVRFFHDSIQTYLTARGLAQMDRASWPRFFLEAAAAPRFRELTESRGAVPEIFDMCVQVLGTQEAVEKLLANELESWAAAYHEDLPMTAIRDAAPLELREALPKSPAGPEELLMAAVRACRESLHPRRSMAAVFAALAPLVDAAKARRTSSQQ